ncbi:MAG: alcohol dehydrogenase catalytic domain-containing protein [Armatimonadetes bacterium]|nr:alcohol dehydrogenase catalytic domain-containing protein [Armatimonadota bacterium]
MEEVPEPRPGPGEVLIEVEAVGVCASDLHYYLHGSIGGLTAADGLILGHEFAGRVVEIGPDSISSPAPLPQEERGGNGVDHSPPALKVGQRVAVEPVRPCNACRECGRGDYHLCRTLKFFGTPPTDGALCERVVCPAEWAFPLPDHLSPAEGAMMEPLAVGVYAAELADLRGGETAAVVGCGAIGLSTLQALRAAGASKAHGEDPIPERAELAVRLGGEPDSCPPHSADVAAECAGTPEALVRALELVRPGGTVLVVGIPDEDTLAFPAALARRKGLTMKFVRRYRHSFPRAIRWTAEGKVSVAPFLTHRFPTEQTQAAFELAASQGGGVIRAWVDLTDKDSSGAGIQSRGHEGHNDI